MRATLRLLAAPRSKVRAISRQPPAAVATGRRRGESDNLENTSRENEILMTLARPVLPPPPLSERERARRRRLMIDYGRLRRAMFLESERKANAFLVAKLTAIDALPQARRAEAFEPRERPHPAKFPIWTHTPPIANFNVGDLTKQSKRELN